MTTATVFYGEKQYGVIHVNFYGNTSNEYVISGTKGEIRIYGHSPTKCELKLFGTRKEKTHRKVMNHTVKEFELPKNLNTIRPFNFVNSEGLFYEVCGVIEDLDKGLLQSSKYNWKEMLIAATISDEIKKQIGLVYKQDQSSKL
ncbi:dimeric dihydrodiol dehydrogenase [Reticulomyxa filosa]|uniref:Dimeric dihydrodiol dehydrogenase n=1 Tax=Reticulomyxa filosa TaxID=46433 RepID=X6M7D4_RETFI|nr:dimeric dihydrodiol dehydrogenase [Reticulomyxa filosa]|eukprot:ETO08935.1 dimeric dihydrodiol dehydrogenase [Reticulomyxa filosa]